MKRLIILIVFFIIIFICGGIWFFSGLTPVGSDITLKKFVISQGETASQIGQELDKENIIKSGLVFRIYSQVTQSAKIIKPGSYELSSNFWIPQVIQKLLAGPTEVWVTIPEGYRREEIVNTFIESLSLTGKDAKSFYDSFLNDTTNQEGYLFPDTYLVPKDATEKDVVKMIQTNFKTKVNFPVSNNTIILASILERETKTDEERPVVAGILLKRIDAGWPLQADATIQYVVGDSSNYWPVVNGNDLKIDSAYNTYTNIGLPPTPICNPGLSSIKAAANPTQSDYWYYIHDKDGQIHYAATIDEQNANISKYLN